MRWCSEVLCTTFCHINHDSERQLENGWMHNFDMDKHSIEFINFFKSLEMYQPGSQRGGFVARRQWLQEWCVEEQKWYRRRCRWVVRGSLPGQCSYRLHRGGTLPQEPALLPTVVPKTPGEGRKKEKEEWEKPMAGRQKERRQYLVEGMSVMLSEL